MSHQTDLFGPMVSGHEVEAAFTATLNTWLPTYIAHMATLYDYDDGLPAIQSVSVWPDDLPDGWPEHQLPHLAIAMPGTVEAPLRDGSGDTRMTFEFGVAVVCSASSRAATQKLAYVYALAVQGAILQRRSLGGVSRGIDMTGMRPLDLGEKTRSLAAQITTFEVEVDNMVSTNHGPTDPSEPPYDPAGFPYDVTDVNLDVENVAVLP